MAKKKAKASLKGASKLTAKARVGAPLSGNPDHPVAAIRLKLGLTQLEMANQMGLGMSAYHEIESSADKVRTRHLQQAERVAFFVASERKDPSLLPEAYLRAVKRLKELV